MGVIPDFSIQRISISRTFWRSYQWIDNLPYLTELHGNNIDTLTDTVYGPLAEVALLEGSKIYLGGNILNKIYRIILAD